MSLNMQLVFKSDALFSRRRYICTETCCRCYFNAVWIKTVYTVGAIQGVLRHRMHGMDNL